MGESLINEQIDDYDTSSSPAILDLPDDCLIKIFSFLEIAEKLKVEGVCKRWYRISKRGWPDVESLSLTCRDFGGNIKQATRILRRSGRLLKSLRIEVNSQMSIYQKVLQKHCPHIRKIELIFNCWAFRSVLKTHSKNLSALFPSLKKIDWLVMMHVNEEVGNRQLKALPERLQGLEITGSWVYAISCPFSANIVRFPNLRVLSLNNFIIEKESLSGFEKLENLTALDLSFCHVPDESIRKIQLFSRLEKLELKRKAIEGLDPSSIHDDHICEIVEGCPKLRDLKLDGLESLSNLSFRAISTLKHLETLHMENLPRVTSRAITNQLQVQNLNCSHCPGIDNEGLNVLIQNSQNLVHLKAQGTADMSSFLQSASEAIKFRNKNSQLTLDVGDSLNSWQRPENFSPLILLI
ncbi:F-box/LRR-repeat protein 7-like [Fopius arisanus]|uniref:F-box/LRR-repeat protein 7-like n=1 Tax=Fopius arisanus TaxID=64838 RepID=A0A9R1TZN3_9HYME|nr:PREDICTED: F-box/LRR-repeat protein 7-like [Fopius arisanus]